MVLCIGQARGLKILLELIPLFVHGHGHRRRYDCIAEQVGVIWNHETTTQDGFRRMVMYYTNMNAMFFLVSKSLQFESQGPDSQPAFRARSWAWVSRSILEFRRPYCRNFGHWSGTISQHRVRYMARKSRVSLNDATTGTPY